MRRASLPPPSAFSNKAEKCGIEPDDKFGETAERLQKEILPIVVTYTRLNRYFVVAMLNIAW